MTAKTKQRPKRRKPSTCNTSREDNRSRDEPREIKVEGLKYFAMLQPLLARLRREQCQRDRAGNRTLHYDQYCMLVLL